MACRDCMSGSPCGTPGCTSRKEVFDVVKDLDRLLSAGAFADVDSFLGALDVNKIDNPAYLLAIVNYVAIARSRGDILVNGPAFADRARCRMALLIGEERTEKLLRNRLYSWMQTS